MKSVPRRLRIKADLQRSKSQADPNGAPSNADKSMDGRLKWPNLGWLIPSIPLLVAAIRVVVASRGNAATLATLTSTLDIQGLLSNTVAQMLPVTAGCIVMPWLYVSLRNSRTTSKDSGGEVPAGKGLRALHESVNGIISRIEVAFIFLSNPVGILFGLISAYRVRSVLRDLDDLPFRITLYVAAVFSIDFILLSLVASVIQTGAIWLPSQEIREPGAAPFTGYVLSSDGGELLILRRNGTVESAGQGTAHQYCGDSWISEIPSAPILTYFFGHVPAEPVSCP